MEKRRLIVIRILSYTLTQQNFTNVGYLWCNLVIILQRKGRDLTQFYDKSPTPTEMSKGQNDNTKTPQKVRLQYGCGQI